MTTSPVMSLTDELVSELEEACREYRQGFMIETSEVIALLRERAEMQQQLRAAMISVDNCELFRKDAERYQWLRESAWYAGPDSFFCGEGGEMNDYKNHNYRADTLDAAIDAAMQESKQ